MKTCSRCVMNDKYDSTITFDKEGRCNYCTEQINRMKEVYFPNELGEKKLKSLISQIKEDGKGKKYDCLMGISGGLDSSYLAYLGYKWGLRILAVHIDDGFDTEISTNNIKKLVSATGIDLRVIQPDFEQYAELTKAYMRAGVCDIANPQDNILFAFLYDVARKNKIKYFLTGGNFSLESILRQGENHDAFDVVNIKDIHKKFGTMPINKLKFISPYKKYLDVKLLGLKTFRPLDLINYRMDKAYAELKEFCAFEYYGGKHLENYLTAFIQLYWMPKKFNFEKKSSHLSSMIISNQISREEALIELDKPLYVAEDMNYYINLVKEKFNLSDAEFNEIMNSKVHRHDEYRVDKMASFLRKMRR